MKIPAAIAEQACSISMIGTTVVVDCDERKDAEELIDWLTTLVEPAQHRDAEFADRVWKALKGDHNDLNKQAIILQAFRDLRTGD